MSIYATLWHLQFPLHGDAYVRCEWVEVLAQGVPAHIGTPTPGYSYESGDPYEAFLPPALRIESGASEDDLRAVVFVMSTSTKGTARSGPARLPVHGAARDQAATGAGSHRA